MKLYRVELQGMTYTMVTSPAYGLPYVVANSMDEAEQLVKEYLEENNIGFSKDREVKSITLLAEEGRYPDCGYQLFIKKE